MIKDKRMPEIKERQRLPAKCKASAARRGAVTQNLFTFSVNRSRSELQAFDRRRGHRLDL